MLGCLLSFHFAMAIVDYWLAFLVLLGTIGWDCYLFFGVIIECWLAFIAFTRAITYWMGY